MKCCICGKSFKGYGNNPYPVDMHPDHKCCDQCNATVVIPARLNRIIHHNKIYDAILGFAVGDALGVPYEFKKRGSFFCNDMIGNGTWNQPTGTWSDDTSMVLATMDNISSCKKFDPDSMMGAFLKWYTAGNYTPWGECFDIGRATAQALNRYMNGIDPAFCGGKSELDNGNGALMRILPFAFLDYNEDIIDRACALTHNTSRSKFACEMYIQICQALLCDEIDYDNPFLAMIKNMNRDQIRSTGYVLDSLIAAIWCFLTTENYKTCVLTAVNLGGDTDTIAALAGGLAGIKYGMDSIPKKWRDSLANSDMIYKICDNFSKFLIDKKSR